MGKLLYILVCFLLSAQIAVAQVAPGTTNSKTLDGIGNKITSTVTGLSRGLDINCLAGCGGAVGTTDSNIIELLGVAPSATNPFPNRLSTGVAYYDARDRNWTLASGTDSVAAVQSGVWSIGRTWTLASGTDSVTVVNAGLTNLDVLLSTRSSEATLLNVLTTSAFEARINTLGQKTMANSTPVVLASDQSALAVTGTFFQATQPVSGNLGRTWVLASGTDSVAAVQSGAWSVTANAGTNLNTSALLLDATLTNRFPAGSTPGDNESNAVTISRLGTFNYIFDGATWDRWTGAVSQSGTWNIGTVTTVTNPVAVTNAGLTNLDVALSTRVAEATFTARINTLGQKAMAASTPVVLPSDQAAIPVTVLSTVANANDDGTCPSGAASFTVLASNASRTWAAIWASPGNTDDVYIKLGTTATSSDARIAPGQPINFTAGRIYTGRIDAFPASGTQAVCAMELN